jgi:hypothetical protein
MAIGTVLGSTSFAIRAAGEHGCPERRARPRAFGGALLVAAPGSCCSRIHTRCRRRARSSVAMRR